ncbi:hypothetical protein MMC30_002172 [Trapelia coarctata]|nr:hypothetical protein [Trapelia coarctata]
MTGVEVVAVIACVAGIVSAFKDGHGIVQSIKEKRRRIQGRTPSKYLEASLAAGHVAVKAKKEEGVERFGTAFAIGDDIAISQLKDILIELQTHLLRHLRYAQEDENITDFTILIHASDIGRVKAVRTLCDLYMRIATANPLQPFGNYGPSSPEFIEIATTMVQRTIEDRQSNGVQGSNIVPTVVDEQPRPTDRQRITTIPSRVAAHDGSRQTPLSPANGNQSRRNTIWERLSFRLSTRMHEEPRAIQAQSTLTTRSSTSSTSHDGSSHTSTEPPQSGAASFDSDAAMRATNTSPFASERYIFEHEDNPWAEAPSTRTMGVSTGSQLSPPSLPTPTTIVPPVPRPSPARLNLPSSANNFAGFCKGAFSLQVGSQTLKLARDIGPVMSTSFFFACRKCAFGGPAFARSGGWEYDTSVHKAHGVHYRWLFLAKSHVKQSKAKNGIYNYKCIFCVLQNIDSPVYQRAGNLMQHIATHRGEQLGETILDRTSCIDGRVAAEDEQFDINLTLPEKQQEPSIPQHTQFPYRLPEIPVSPHTAFGDFG